MNKIAKFKSWMNENAPTLTFIYDNKFVGMAYDRFASLPGKQQKQLFLSLLGIFGASVVGYLIYAYLGLWSQSRSIDKSHQAINLLQQFQKVQRNQSQAGSAAGQNLQGPGRFKDFLIRQGQVATIAKRLIQIKEVPGGSGEGDIKTIRASVTLEKITLSQLKKYLSVLEFGDMGVRVSYVHVTNDEQLRGYMNVELSVVAYAFGVGAE